MADRGYIVVNMVKQNRETSGLKLITRLWPHLHTSHTPSLVKSVTSKYRYWPNIRGYRNKTYYTWPDRPTIALHAHTVQWIKDHIPTGIDWLTIRNHKTYTPYRELPSRTRIDKLLGDYMLGVGTPPDWDE